MAVGSHLSPDFVGYDTGVPSSTAATVGYVGLLDFTGIPVGVSSVVAAQVGFVGFLDFVGFPVGVGEAVVPPAPELPSLAGGGISYDEYLRRKRKKGDEEILFL